MTTSRIPLRSITLLCSEGPRQDDVGQPLASWALAELAIARIADLTPAGAVVRTDFVIEWSDGQIFTDHCFVTRPMGRQLEPLAGHVWRSLAFFAGRWRPSHMTPAEHATDLAAEPAGRTAEAAYVLDTYELGRAP